MSRTPEFKVTGTITSVERHSTSRNGNPTFEVTIMDGFGGTHTFRTGTDASIGYGIENYRPDSRETRVRHNTLIIRGKRERIVNVTGLTRFDALKANVTF